MTVNIHPALHALCGKYAEEIIRTRRYFHAHPELSTEEVETARAIRAELDRIGVPWRVCGGPTSTLARIEGRNPEKKAILLRADIDALPVTEATGVDYASQCPGKMHACGHDCHIAMLLTAVKMLNELKDDFEGTVVFAFQAAEESCLGAAPMVADGALDGVDACYAQHVWWDVPAGKFALCKGPAMASGDRFRIEIEGRPGHGAAPETCIDATVIGAAIIMNLQTIVSREVLPFNAAVVSVGSLESGTRFNVISGSAVMEGTVRTFLPEEREHILRRIEEIALGTAQTLRGKARVMIDRLSPPVMNDAAMTDMVRDVAAALWGEDAPQAYGPVMPCEDFSYFQEKVPGVMAFLGIRNPECGACYAQHHDKYNVDESALIRGAGMYAQTALTFLAG